MKRTSHDFISSEIGDVILRLGWRCTMLRRARLMSWCYVEFGLMRGTTADDVGRRVASGLSAEFLAFE